MYQEIGNDKKFFLGSAKAQFGATIAEALVAPTVGSMDDVSFEMVGSSGKIEFQNRKSVNKKTVTGCKVSFKYGELDLDKVFQFFGSDADALSAVAGTSGSKTDAVAAGKWGYDKPLAFLNQNASGEKPTSVTISAGTDGALVAGTDFEIIKIGRVWAYVLLDAASGKLTTENQALTVAYTVTPATGKVLEFNASNSIPDTFAIVLTHETDAGEIFQIQVYAAQSSSFFKLPFVKDGGTDVVKADAEFEGTADNNNKIAKIIDSRDIYDI